MVSFFLLVRLRHIGELGPDPVQVALETPAATCIEAARRAALDRQPERPHNVDNLGVHMIPARPGSVGATDCGAGYMGRCMGAEAFGVGCGARLRPGRLAEVAVIAETQVLLAVICTQCAKE